MNVMKTLKHAVAITGLATVMLAASGSAQSLKGHDTNAPVDVNADRLEVQDRADRAVFTGNVRVRQGGLALNAGRLTVAYAGAAGSGVSIKRIDATGGVEVRSADQYASGDFATYDLPRRMITVIGDVQLTQGGNTINGGRLTIDLASGRSVIEGGAGTSSTGGRVSGHFTVARGN